MWPECACKPDSVPLVGAVIIHLGCRLLGISSDQPEDPFAGL